MLHQNINKQLKLTVMKINIKSKTVIIENTINYENGFYCDFTTKNDELINYKFYNDKVDNLVYVKNEERLNEYLNSTSVELAYLVEKDKFKILDLEFLTTFNEVDKLFYFNHSSWVFGDNNGNALCPVIYLEEIFMSNWCKLETYTEKCKEYLNLLNSKFIIESEIYPIPYYNWSREDDVDYGDHNTLRLKVKVDNETYRKCLGDEKSFNDDCKLRLIEFLKKI